MLDVFYALGGYKGMTSLKTTLETIAIMMVVIISFMLSSHMKSTKTHVDFSRNATDAAFYGITLDTGYENISQDIVIQERADTRTIQDAFFWGVPRAK